MAKLHLYFLAKDEPILRGKNREIGFPLSTEVVKLIQKMKIAVKEFKGVGLAAPQVGVNLMLAVINLPDAGIPPFAIINPRIVSKSIKKTVMEEGCLSIPGRFGLVKRPAKIEVETYRENGKKVLIKADKFLAKVLLHEIDHLNGIVIADKFEK